MSCDDYCCNHGCNQGRNCPARRKPATPPKPASNWRIKLRGRITWCFKSPGWIRFGNIILRWEKA